MTPEQKMEVDSQEFEAKAETMKKKIRAQTGLVLEMSSGMQSIALKIMRNVFRKWMNRSVGVLITEWRIRVEKVCVPFCLPCF